MNHPRSSFARLSPRLAAAIGRQTVAPPCGLPATLDHAQMYDDRRAGAARGKCGRHAPVRLGWGAGHSVGACMSAIGFSSPVGAVPPLKLGRWRHNHRSFFQHVAQCAFQGRSDLAALAAKIAARRQAMISKTDQEKGQK